MKVRWFILLLMYSFLVSGLFAYDWSTNPGGGTEANPYQISTPEQLNSIGDYYELMDKCFILTADIDMSAHTGSIPYNIIGSSIAFSGIFDGDNYVVSNLSINLPNQSYVGLFGITRGAQIKQLGLENINVTGSSYVGGMIGSSQDTVIEGCYTTGSVTGTDPEWTRCGGLIGHGRSLNQVTITDCYSTCDISVAGKAGGGLIGGYWSGRIINCYATGSVSGNAYLGGLVGVISTTANYPEMGLVRCCFSTGDVTGDNRLGGLVGEIGSANITNSYATGSVSGNSVVGGLTGCVYLYPYDGYGDAYVKKSYSTGKVTGSSETGGLVGRHWNQSVKVYDSYWDTQTSGWSYSSGGMGKTTAEMQIQDTYTNWNFDTVWSMGTNPVLQWELNPLQAQIDAAADGDVIVVEPGVYEGSLFFKGKNITLTSTDPTDSAVVDATVLQGRGNGSVVTFAGTEGDSCVLTGFTITGGSSLRGGGICGNSTQAGISHCVIQNNKASSGGGIADCLGNIEKCIISGNSAISNGGGLVKCAGTISNCLIVNNSAVTGAGLNNCDGEIINCTIADNTATNNGGGLRRCDGEISNCIIWSNAPDDQFECPNLTYCCYSGASGEGNIHVDPLFVDSTGDDYHLQQESPCIDSGDPDSDYSNEPIPNGERINMGVYGNTLEAARVPHIPQSKLLASDGAPEDYFGNSVSINGDYAIVGAEWDDDHGRNSGSAYIFYYNGSVWIEQAKLTPADGNQSDLFGRSVCIEGDFAFVGAPFDDDFGIDSGSVYVFHYDGLSWTQQAKLSAEDISAESRFGSSVSVDANHLIVGATQYESSSSGSAYIFNYDGMAWIQQSKLMPSDGAARDFFGSSVCIDGDFAIVGAFWNDDHGSSSGSAYIFHYDGVSWTQQIKLTAEDAAAEDEFGYAVSIDNEYAVVGAHYDDDHGMNSGSVYIFHYDGLSWHQQVKLTASDADAENAFGHSVSIEGGTVITGAFFDNDNGDYSGAAYIYHYDGTSWRQQKKLTPSDGAPHDLFGVSVDVNEGIFIIGAGGDNDNGDSSGSAYIYGERLPEYLSVSGLEMVSKRRISRSVFEYVYQLVVTNSHVEPLSDIAITLLPDSDNMTVIDERVEINQIGAGETIIASDTVSLQVDRTDGPVAADWLIEYGTPATQVSQPVTFGLLADIISDGIVDDQDLMRLIQSWMTDDPVADIVSTPEEPTDIVNLNDFRILSEEWKK